MANKFLSYSKHGGQNLTTGDLTQHWRIRNTFASYVTGRKQRVVIDGAFSGWRDVLSGVPQGSVVGPLLFIIFINGLLSSLSCTAHVYADDVMLFEIGETEEVNKSLESNLGKVETWSSQWLVEFNEAKTIAMSFGTDPSRPLNFRGSSIQDSASHKHLGVILDSTLKWTTHINMIVEKAETRLRYLTLARRLGPQAVLSNIYTTLIRPTTEYCCSVWSNITVSDAMPLQKFQNRAARLITGAPFFTSIDKLHTELGLDFLDARRKYFRLTFYHKLIEGKMPSYLTDRIPQYDHKYNTRKKKAKTFAYRYSLFKNSLLPMAAREYNELPERVRRLKNKNVKVSTFKDNVKNFFQDQGIFKSKQPKYFRWGSKVENSLHCSLRMGFTRLNLHQFVYQNKGDPKCNTCQVNENVEHFLIQCARFDSERAVMLKQVRDILQGSDSPHLLNVFRMNKGFVNLLLNGDPSISNDDNWRLFKAVQKYITDTRRFNSLEPRE